MTIDILQREVIIHVLSKKHDMKYISFRKIYINSGEPIKNADIS